MQIYQPMNVHISFFRGRQMHDNFDKTTHFESRWEYDNPEWEKKIKDDVLYSVVLSEDHWDSEGSLAGDSVGCRYHVYNFEETPDWIIELLSARDSADMHIERYKSNFLKNF